MKKILFVIFFFIHLIIYSQNYSRSSRLMDDIGWTSWKNVFTYLLDGLYYLIPGLILLIGTQHIFLKRDYDDLKIHKSLEIVLAIISLGGLILTGYGAFHLIFLISNLEILLWSTIFIGGTIILIIIILQWLYKTIKRSKKKVET